MQRRTFLASAAALAVVGCSPRADGPVVEDVARLDAYDVGAILPYRLHASRQQFRRAYPEIERFAALKRRHDPQGRIRNALWNTYLA